MLRFQTMSALHRPAQRLTGTQQSTSRRRGELDAVLGRDGCQCGRYVHPKHLLLPRPSDALIVAKKSADLTTISVPNDKLSISPMSLSLLDTVGSTRLILRTVEASDLVDLLEVNGDPEVTKFLPYSTWQSMYDAEIWFARMELLASAGTARQLVLVQHSDAKVIGTLLLFRYDEANSRVELGYVLGRQYWGKGLMREAIVATQAWAVESQSIRRMEAEVNPDNRVSCELLQKLNFTLEGRLRKRWVANGSAYDTNMYGWLAHE